jgi:hypothetical protein
MLIFLASLGQSVTLDWRNVCCRDNIYMIALLVTEFSRVSTRAEESRGGYNVISAGVRLG